MFFETVVLDKVKLVDLDTLFTSLIVSICICSFIYIDITGRNNGVEFRIYIFISSRLGETGRLGSPKRCKILTAVFGLLKYHILGNVMTNSL